jgi:hypothetical protein
LLGGDVADVVGVAGAVEVGVDCALDAVEVVGCVAAVELLVELLLPQPAITQTPSADASAPNVRVLIAIRREA